MTCTMNGGGDVSLCFADLAAQYCDEGEQPDVVFVPFQAALATGDDPRRILHYLTTLGCHPRTLQDLLNAVNTLPNEEELFAFEVVEGVAVSVASDGAWFVYTE